jgi:hypothetical protein
MAYPMAMVLVCATVLVEPSGRPRPPGRAIDVAIGRAWPSEPELAREIRSREVRGLLGHVH